MQGSTGFLDQNLKGGRSHGIFLQPDNPRLAIEIHGNAELLRQVLLWKLKIFYGKGADFKLLFDALA